MGNILEVILPYPGQDTDIRPEAHLGFPQSRNVSPLFANTSIFPLKYNEAIMSVDVEQQLKFLRYSLPPLTTLMMEAEEISDTFDFYFNIDIADCPRKVSLFLRLNLIYVDIIFTPSLHRTSLFIPEFKKLPQEGGLLTHINVSC
jgi:hypothetical protein